MAERGLAGAPREPPTRFVQGVGNVSLKIKKIGRDMETRFSKDFDPWLSVSPFFCVVWVEGKRGGERRELA